LPSLDPLDPQFICDKSQRRQTVERLERALAAISYCILQDGPVYAPLLERLEREIADRRADNDIVARARRNLELLQAAAKALIEGAPPIT
jgi:hypothetical protein